MHGVVHHFYQVPGHPMVAHTTAAAKGSPPALVAIACAINFCILTPTEPAVDCVLRSDFDSMLRELNCIPAPIMIGNLVYTG